MLLLLYSLLPPFFLPSPWSQVGRKIYLALLLFIIYYLLFIIYYLLFTPPLTQLSYPLYPTSLLPHFRLQDYKSNSSIFSNSSTMDHAQAQRRLSTSLHQVCKISNSPAHHIPLHIFLSDHHPIKVCTIMLNLLFLAFPCSSYH